ncbi:hypothetical protein [Pelagibacterium xiamenense]|uniref:hypothetical protein n=1 Tax=Pelagibacterium xiamenense TaxID=2901140 RepID=UPI001E38E2BC|nr:hypothetical protein [Pelagibacterium xiamenense]MCD7058606.1 hypothetical protein [Pelagibacterium xiamenense]
MLDKCTAIVMATDKAWIERCKKLAHTAGFEETYGFLGVDDIARRVRKTPVQFLFAHYELGEDVLRETMIAIRHHHERDVKFMPMVVFTKDQSVASLKHFLKMGFDDIVAFPCAMTHLVGRLELQLDRKLDYFQAGDYFGPDRRRLMEEDEDYRRERRAGGTYTHFVIQRDIEHGVRILHQKQEHARESA